MEIFDDEGRQLDATFSVRTDRRSTSLIFESRGGKRGTASARNVDYAEGLDLLLKRLKSMGATLLDVLVDTRSVADLSEEERKVQLPTFPLPLKLTTVQDVHALRLAIGRGQQPVGRAPGAKSGGGNPTRRLRIRLQLAGERAPTNQELEGALAQPDVDTEAQALVRALTSAKARHQGFGPDYPTRRAIELHAMRLAEKHYAADGWEVADVSSRKPYDLHCTRRTDVLRVEVKGTTSSGASVLVTANEVQNAQKYARDTALFVVSYVRVASSEDGPVASGGKITELRPWDPSSGVLEAIGYRFFLPAPVESL